MKSAEELAHYYVRKKTLTGLSIEKYISIYQRISHYTIPSDVILFSFSGFQKRLNPYHHEGFFIYVLTADYLIALDTSEKLLDQKFSLKTMTKLSSQSGLYYSHLTLTINHQLYQIDSPVIEEFIICLTKLLPAYTIKQATLEKNENSEAERKALETNQSAKENWLITLCFGQSSSKKLSLAVELAKKTATYYEEDMLDNKKSFQASYTKEHYLKFIELYEIVGLWKSTSIKIQHVPIERSIVGGLNYCYGDKLKSNNNGFCFGASAYTNNPFGCHRLKISVGNHSWWSFGRYNDEKNWVIDKIALKKRMLEQAQSYLYCPAFDLEYSLLVLDALPKFLNPKKDQENWIFYNDSVSPKCPDEERIESNNHFIVH